ncbi:hypothetical protein BpHYR1_017928 [Brachionus plicatilis]|uniref:Uncharacterized protein n=1 Tax=Brachionus plicatilis TaxID=10195 RepID=A0A3M7SXB2_BRAPC|nr:hypothetical protein BpHYR1_017928 [Brachionus plicatilis]
MLNFFFPRDIWHEYFSFSDTPICSISNCTSAKKCLQEYLDRRLLDLDEGKDVDSLKVQKLLIFMDFMFYFVVIFSEKYASNNEYLTYFCSKFLTKNKLFPKIKKHLGPHNKILNSLNKKVLKGHSKITLIENKDQCLKSSITIPSDYFFDKS